MPAQRGGRRKGHVEIGEEDQGQNGREDQLVHRPGASEQQRQLSIGGYGPDKSTSSMEAITRAERTCQKAGHGDGYKLFVGRPNRRQLQDLPLYDHGHGAITNRDCD